jgi:hypothetical protein
MTTRFNSVTQQASVSVCRWNAIASELAVSEKQRPGWERFVATCDSIAKELSQSESEFSPLCADQPPSLYCALETVACRLSLRLTKAQTILVQLEPFYETLSDKQKWRANRLLLRVLDGLLADSAADHMASEETSFGLGSISDVAPRAQTNAAGSDQLGRLSAQKGLSAELFSHRHRRNIATGQEQFVP